MKEYIKKNIDLITKIILIIIIVILLIRNCTLLQENRNNQNKTPGGNVEIIEIKCDETGCRTIKKQINSLSFTENKVSVKNGETINLIVNIKPIELFSDKLTWESSDPSIATVDENGVVRGIKEGTVTITVASSNGKKATCTVTVVKETVDAAKIKLISEKTNIEEGTVTQIKAVIEPENVTSRNLIWTSSDNSVATVDENGIVKGIKAGTVTITAKIKDSKVAANITITIEEEADPGNLEVYDNAHEPLFWNGASDLQIFYKSLNTINDKIAPESSNTYQFVIKNSTIYNLKYKINFIETNEYNINMKYKLKKNDTYIVDHYVSASELDISNMILNRNENDTYYLEWKWISSSNDTSIGENPEAKYDLKIEVKAERTNG